MPVSTSDCKASVGQDLGTSSSQPGVLELSSDDPSSPPTGSRVSSCAVSRRTSIGPNLRPAVDDAVQTSTSESHENSIVRAKQSCGAEILNFEHLKMQLDKLTGQNKEKQRQSDAENGNSTISPSPSCCSFSSHAAILNLPGVSSWPSGLDRTPSVESDVLFPADNGVSSASSAATDNTIAFPCKYTAIEQKLLTSDPVCAALSVASTRGDLLGLMVGGQQMKHECLVASHQHHHSHHHHHEIPAHEPVTQPTVVGMAHPQLMNVGTTSGAFQLPGYLHEHIQPLPEWQQQALLLQQQQQSLRQIQAQYPLITQCQQILRLQQQLQQHQQAIQRVYSTVLQSQRKPDMMQNASFGPLPMASAVSPQYLQWQTQLTNLLMESGLSPEKSCELVQQLQHIMVPTASLPVYVPGAPASQLLNGSGCSFDPFSHLHSHLSLPSQLCTSGLPQPLLASWSNVQVAYAQVVQLLARPNPLITPELLESMFAQLPPPLELNASVFQNPGAAFESLYVKYLELLAMQVNQLPVTPVQLVPPVSVHGFFGSDYSSSAYLNKLVGEVSNVEDSRCHVAVDNKQLGTPTKVAHASYTAVDGSYSTQNCLLRRGASVDSESGDIPGSKIPGIPHSNMSSLRHQNASTGNGASKVSGGAIPRKSIDCPQGLADLDMALKEKLRPRTTKGVAQTIPEHTRTSTAAVVSIGVVGSVSSAPFQSTVTTVACDAERSSVNALNCTTVVASRNTSSVMHDISAMPKLRGTSSTKCAPMVVSEKVDVVKKQQGTVVRETACKAGDIPTATPSVLRTSSIASGNIQLHEGSKDIVKPASSSMFVNVTASLVPFLDAGKSSSHFRECTSDLCLPLTAVTLPMLSSVGSDINRQHVSDSAIAATTTHLAHKHLQKKLSLADQENFSAIDVAARQAHSMMSVSSEFCNSDF